MMSRRIWRWLESTTAGADHLSWGDIAFAVVLSVAAALSAFGLLGSNAHNPNAGWAAAVAVLLMTGPVLFARRWPVPVCAALALGAAANWVLIGHLVRCGAGLIAVFYVAFVLGVYVRTWAVVLIGLALLSANIVCQSFSDPQLGPIVSTFMIPVAVAFAGCGRLVASRNIAVMRLQETTARLRVQREENAKLAVTSEQARIARGLDEFLYERVDQIETSAQFGRAALYTSPDDARDAFHSISQSGRAALNRMREVVADLTDDVVVGLPVAEPAPMLAQLDRLLADAGEDSTALQVLGDPRLLPPGLELAAYRIVERLLEAVDGDAGAVGHGHPRVVVEFLPHELRLTVIGRPSRRAQSRAALAAAGERATVQGGSIETITGDQGPTTIVALPLAVAHV
jgi:signal transduction histidine kinase